MPRAIGEISGYSLDMREALTDSATVTWDFSVENKVIAHATGSGGSSLTVAGPDGVPTVTNVSTINMVSGSVTDDGGGAVSIATGTQFTYDSQLHCYTAPRP